MLSESRQTGSYYTSGNVAEYMSRWAIRNSDDILLEPSFGDGVFIDKAYERYQSLGNTKPEIHAVELQERPFSNYLAKNKGTIKAHLNDFLDVGIVPIVDAVIGNPPYVSLRKLPERQRENAVRIIEQNRLNMSMNGSLWFPFIVHATTMLKPGGRLAFVLPLEITYVRYAFKLWQYLGANYSDLTVIRVFEDFFPEVDVETILLFAYGKGGKTSKINHQVYRSIEKLKDGAPIADTTVYIRDIINNSKPFTSALLSEDQSYLFMRLKEEGLIEKITGSCKSKIGYVSADKNYFHPDEGIRNRFQLPEENFVPCILNSKEINGGTGIGLSAEKGQCDSLLYLPKEITSGDEAYIRHGEKTGVSDKYKCRMRSPWYITPNVEIPDVILSVFGDVPKLIINGGGYAVSNSLLCGMLKKGIDPKNFICRWYNSLTLLSIELNVHSLGGGSLVFIPGEADALDIVKPLSPEHIDQVYDRLNKCVIDGKVQDAYLLGDELVLKRMLSVSDKQIDLIREAVSRLRAWRLPDKRRKL